MDFLNLKIGQNAFKSNKKYKNSVSVYIDFASSLVKFYAVEENGARSTSEETLKSKMIGDDFYAELTEMAKRYFSVRTELDDTAVVVVIPDYLVSTDVITVPNLGKKRNDDAIVISIDKTYRNHTELQINRQLAMQNKQHACYSLSVLRMSTIAGLRSAFNSAGVQIFCITFAANAAVNAINSASKKLSSQSYLLLDVKEERSQFVFVCHGKAISYYSLPFGYSILEGRKLASEDMLFDHSTAELVVLNAKEKARAKQLTMESEERDANEEVDENDIDFEQSMANPTEPTQIKVLPKKQPRKLPKFMQRETPETDEGFACENFRIFVKWALNLIQSNERITMLGEPECVYVNMPSDYKFILDDLKNQTEENGLPFEELDLEDVDTGVMRDLPLYGGVYSTSQNKQHNF